MPGDIKVKYASSVPLTVTNLHSLASSQDWTAGWGGATVTNTSNAYEDYMVGGSFTTHASNRQAGEIRLYVVASFNDTPTYPAVSSGTAGTEGAIAFTDTEERDGACALLAQLVVDNTASAVYPVPMRGLAHLFGGRVPTHFFLFVAQNCSTTTTAGLAAAGSALYLTGVFSQYT